MSARLLQGDMREKLAELADSSVDSIVTDPPYGLGFMGKDWDRGVPGVEFWRLLLRVAKPGTHLLAFGGSRTFHRLWCAVEDAGWDLRDTILWLHGEGFPKSSNQEGAWEGWGTALKPAFEPVLMARKPLIGSVAVNLQAHGVGALNIDACRVESEARPLREREGQYRPENVDLPSGSRAVGETTQGRWPANVLHDGSDEVVAAFPNAPGQQADISYSAPSEKTSNVYGRMRREGEPSADIENGGTVGFQMRPGARRLDSGSAARFFWCPKASTRDREEGCEGLPLQEGGVRSETSGQHITRRDGGAPGQVHNNHPTVKPTELMRYLIRLVTPKGGLVLDPFMGSGSTGKACEREAMNFIGIEIDPAYIEIAKRRIVGVAPLFADVQA
jgi:hypothetical protein